MPEKMHQQSGFDLPDKHVWYEVLLGRQPVLRLGLGLTPMIGAAVTLASGLCLAALTALTLLSGSVLLSLLRKQMAKRGRMGLLLRLMVFMLLSAAGGWVVTLALPEMAVDLGIYLPLCGVSALLLYGWERQEVSVVAKAAPNAAVTGSAYVLAALLFSALREVLGKGSIGGASLFAQAPLGILALPMGGFVLMGLLMGGWAVLAGRLQRWTKRW